jgi:hypothetical protein
MAARVGKVYGAVAPTRRVRIIVQQYENGKPVSSASSIVVGHSFAKVNAVIEAALAAAYPSPDEDEDEDVADEPEETPIPTTRRLKKVRK